MIDAGPRKNVSRTGVDLKFVETVLPDRIECRCVAGVVQQLDMPVPLGAKPYVNLTVAQARVTWPGVIAIAISKLDAELKVRSRGRGRRGAGGTTRRQGQERSHRGNA